MSQLGQFAQLSYLLNNLNSKEISSAALENLKYDKNLLNQVSSQIQGNTNVGSGDGRYGHTQSHFLANPSQYLLSQLSQFGPVKTQGNAPLKQSQVNEEGNQN